MNCFVLLATYWGSPLSSWCKDWKIRRVRWSTCSSRGRICTSSTGVFLLGIHLNITFFLSLTLLIRNCLFPVSGSGCTVPWTWLWTPLNGLWDQTWTWTSFTPCGWSECSLQSEPILQDSAGNWPEPTLFLSYLLFGSSHMTRSSARSRFKAFSDLVQRCLITVPTRLEVPFNPAQFWNCYSFHNKVRASLHHWCLRVSSVHPLTRLFTVTVRWSVSISGSSHNPSIHCYWRDSDLQWLITLSSTWGMQT